MNKYCIENNKISLKKLQKNFRKNFHLKIQRKSFQGFILDGLFDLKQYEEKISIRNKEVLRKIDKIIKSRSIKKVLLKRNDLNI